MMQQGEFWNIHNQIKCSRIKEKSTKAGST